MIPEVQGAGLDSGWFPSCESSAVGRLRDSGWEAPWVLLRAAPQPGQSPSLSVLGFFFSMKEDLWPGLQFAHLQGV